MSVSWHVEDGEKYGSRRRSVVNSNAGLPPPGVLTHRDRHMSSVVSNNPDFADMSEEAQAAAEKDAKVPLKEGLRLYPTAAAWSILLASTIIMEGYDTSLIGSLFAYPTFAEKYSGELTPSGKYEIPAAWQTALMNGSAVGSILGLVANGFLCDHFGYRKTMVGALLLMTAAIFFPFFAPNIEVLLVGQIISGIPWGMFQTLAISYASEVCPTVLRGYLTTYANICWVIGQILAAGVLRGLLSRPDEWSYRIPFALQWIFPLPILIGTLFAPESPWWLVRHGRYDDAKKVMRRLIAQTEDETAVENSVSMMRLTNESEKAISAGTTFWDCFKGTDLRRTEIACLTWACQNMCGSAFMGYSTYFYQNAGLATEQAFNFTMIQYVLGFIGTIIAWTLMARAGRRTLYFWGLVALCIILIVIGGLGFAPAPAPAPSPSKRATGGASSSGSTNAVNPGAAWAVGSLLLLFTLVYNFTVGPVCYALVSEVSSTRLRQKTVVLARMTYNLCALLNNAILPLMLNPLAWNWGAKTGLFWAGVTAICFTWCFFRLPEPKDRTYHELNVLFEWRVGARKFKSTKVDAFRGESIVVERVSEETLREEEGNVVRVGDEKV